MNGLHQHLVVLEQLHDRYVSYQTAYNKLVLEMARRRHYCEAVERIVRGMAKQLEEMTMGKLSLTEFPNSDLLSQMSLEYGVYLIPSMADIFLKTSAFTLKTCQPSGK